MHDQVLTVLGPVPADALGVVLPHEHLLMAFDWPGAWSPRPDEPELTGRRVTIDLLGRVRKDISLVHDNLRLVDVDTAVSELEPYQRAGGRTIVEMSVEGLGVDRERLREVSERTGLHVVAGCGWYVEPSHPHYVGASSIDQLTSRLLAQLRPETSHELPCGIIGEIGLSGPPTPSELKVLRAAVSASRETGVAVSLHTNGWRQGESILEILNVLDEAGADPTRTVVGHLDWGVDYRFVTEVAARGYWVQLDTFGYESLVYEHAADAQSLIEVGCDTERVKMVLRLVEDGYEGQLLLSQDVFTKTALRAFGGFGYAHLLVNIVPLLRRYGLGAEQVEALVTRNPQRMLAGTPAARDRGR